MKTIPICYKCGEPIDKLQEERVKPKAHKTIFYHKKCADLIIKERKNIGKEKNEIL